MDMEDFLRVAKGSSLGKADLGSLLKEEVEEAISPVTENLARLEKKLDLLILSLGRVEKLLTALQPLSKLIGKLPFLN